MSYTDSPHQPVVGEELDKTHLEPPGGTILVDSGGIAWQSKVNYFGVSTWHCMGASPIQQEYQGIEWSQLKARFDRTAPFVVVWIPSRAPRSIQLSRHFSEG